VNSRNVCKDNSPSDWRGKLFADLLQSVHLRSSVYFRPELGAPWGFSLADHGTAFHIVADGKCWIQVTGAAQAVELVAGDFVVVSRGDAHIMRDSAASTTVDFFELAKRSGPDNRGAFRAGGNGVITKLVCGGMQFDNAATDPLLALLPPLIHVKGKDRDGATWLRALASQILEELDSSRAGAQAVVTRLADILFIKAVRTYFEQNIDTARYGWLAAVRDPHIGPALAQLHARPQEPWRVATLARRVALSRSLFAEKFAQLVGEPPLRYLKRLRLNAAAIRLRSTSDKLGAIAADAGYESAAAFTKAFKKYLGKAPGEYRRGRQYRSRASLSSELKQTHRTKVRGSCC
jgi:AraC-like DNA-binding protein